MSQADSTDIYIYIVFVSNIQKPIPTDLIVYRLRCEMVVER